MTRLLDMHILCTGQMTKDGILWHISPEQLERNRQWYADYLHMLGRGATPEAAYDLANLATSGANDMEITQAMMDTLPPVPTSATVAVDSQRDEPGYHESIFPFLY